METKFIVLFAFLGLVVLGLSVYLGILYSRLRGKIRDQKQSIQMAGENLKAGQKKREEEIKSSLRTLSLVIIQEQCPPTEGCIRVKKLMDEIAHLKDREDLAVFHEMYEEVKHFDILQDYKDLPKQEKFKQDTRRFAIEERYSSRLKRGAKNLKALLDNPPFH